MIAVLHGVRVLDFGRFIAAPYCGMLLADMGAEVIRVEQPGGDDDRRFGLVGANGENFTFPSLARNKKGITLDLTRRQSREVLDDLVRCSDVFLHNFGPPAVAALQLTYDDIRAIRPDIIYTGISCFGSQGPDASRTGFDPMAQVSSGGAALTGFAHEPPLRSGVPWVDYSTGLCAALGTLLALRYHDACGEGQAVDCALLQTAVSYTAPMIAEAALTGQQRPRLGNRAAYLGPSDLYRCRDGYVYVAAVTERMWRSLMGLVGRPDLVERADLSTHAQRFDHRAEVDPLVEQWIQQRSVDEVMCAMDSARVPCSVYRTTAEVAADPQVQALRMLEYLDLGEPGLQHVPISGTPIRLSKTPGSVRSRPPSVGEHNDATYHGLLGYSAEHIADLRAQGVI